MAINSTPSNIPITPNIGRPNKLSTYLVDCFILFLGLSVWFSTGVSIAGFNLQIIEVLVLVLFLLNIGGTIRTSLFTRRRTSVFRIHVALIVAVALISLVSLMSSINALDPTATISVAGRYIFGALLLIFLTRTLLQNHKRIVILIWGLVLGGLASTLISLLGMVIPPLHEYAFRYGDRAQGFTNHPNQLGMLLVTTMPLALSQGISGPGRAKFYFAILLLPIGIALTGSKMNLLLLGVAVGAYALLLIFRSRSVLYKAVLSLLVPFLVMFLTWIMGLVLHVVNPRALSTILNMFMDPMSVNAVNSRLELWTLSVEIGSGHPWLGIGGGNAEYYLPYSHAHNVFADFFLSFGFIGLIALVLFLAVLFRLCTYAVSQGMQHRQENISYQLLLSLPLSVFLYIAANFTSDSFGGSTIPVLWIVLSTLLALLSVKPRKARPASHATTITR